jgi:hypothetical protein
VSRLWQDKAAELVAGMQQADLGEFDLLVLMIRCGGAGWSGLRKLSH